MAYSRARQTGTLRGCGVRPDLLVADVGRRVAEVRGKVGWTQHELAVAMHRSTRYVQKLEQGMNINLFTLMRVAVALKVDRRSSCWHPLAPRRANSGDLLGGETLEHRLRVPASGNQSTTCRTYPCRASAHRRNGAGRVVGRTMWNPSLLIAPPGSGRRSSPPSPAIVVAVAANVSGAALHSSTRMGASSNSSTGAGRDAVGVSPRIRRRPRRARARRGAPSGTRGRPPKNVGVPGLRALGVEGDFARGETRRLTCGSGDELAVTRELNAPLLEEDLHIRRPALLRLRT